MPDDARVPERAVCWHCLDVADVLRSLAKQDDGLGTEEARCRLAAHGPNELQAFARSSPWRALASQFKNILVIILLVAALVSGLLGHALEAVVIAVIVLFAVLLGFIQEFRSERALEALREMAAPVGHAIRDGIEMSVPARELVPGDAIVLRAGGRVPADARITSAINLAVVPEALPAVVTISLGIGVRRTVRRQALVRRLPVVETLASTSVICSDKTGTLTRNEMTVRRIATSDGTFDVSGTEYDATEAFLRDGVSVHPPTSVEEALRAAVLSSDARIVQGARGRRRRTPKAPSTSSCPTASSGSGAAARLRSNPWIGSRSWPWSARWRRRVCACVR